MKEQKKKIFGGAQQENKNIGLAKKSTATEAEKKKNKKKEATTNKKENNCSETVAGRPNEKRILSGERNAIPCHGTCHDSTWNGTEWNGMLRCATSTLRIAKAARRESSGAR